MGNMTSAIRRASGAEPNVYYVSFLPLDGGETTWDSTIHCYMPDKPSRGYWFHATRNYTPPKRFFSKTESGVKTTNYYSGLFLKDESKNGVLACSANLLRGSTRDYIDGYRPKGSTITTVTVYRYVMSNGSLSKDGKTASYDFVTYYYEWQLNDKTIVADDILSNYQNYFNPPKWYTLVKLKRISTENKFPYTTSEGWILPQPPRVLDFDYKYNELNNWWCIKDLGAIPNRLVPGLSAAYLETIRNIPNAQVNAIESTREAIQFVATLAKALSTRSVTPLIKGLKKSVSSSRDMWLTYRYTVTTSKMDLEEVRQLTCRLNDLNKIKKQTLTLRGSYIQDDIFYRCAATFKLDDLLPQDFSDWLSAYGFRLNLENVWDMVPFSFVVDWFFHIGNFLSDVDNLYLAHQYKPVSIWYSYETSYDGQGVYTRFPGPPLYSSPFTTVHSSSSKTWAMRIADVISIIG